MKWAITDEETGEVLREVELPPVSQGFALRQLANVLDAMQVAAQLLDSAHAMDATTPPELARKYEALADAVDVSDGAMGYAIALFLRVPIPATGPLYKRGLTCWQGFIEEGWTSEELKALYLALKAHRELRAFGLIKQSVGIHNSFLKGDSPDAIVQRYLWALSAEQWGHTDAWKTKDPEEVSRLISLKMSGVLGAIRLVEDDHV